MAFRKISDMSDSYLDGHRNISSFYKRFTQKSSNNTWSDLSSATGNPSANYYASAPLTASIVDPKLGLPIGTDLPNGYDRYLKKISLLNDAYPGGWATLLFVDVVMYYPFIDMDSTDQQDLDNTISLPRYVDGRGLQTFMVAQGTYVGGAAFDFNYTDTDGNDVSSIGCLTSTTTNPYAIVSTCNGPFSKLEGVAKGLKKINSVTFQTPNGGIAAMVICKPLCSMTYGELGTCSEKDFAIEDAFTLPKLYPGACIVPLVLCKGNMIGCAFMGTIETIWR